jgi:alpha-glucosidase (family GH31 glycosyl hydrolase)
MSYNKLFKDIVFFFLALGLFMARTSLPASPQKNNPAADPRAVVASKNVRFTILTPRLVRMEWSADGIFEDHASLVFINRELPVPKFSSSVQQGWQVIKTDSLTLKYKDDGEKFSRDNLSIQFRLNDSNIVWVPGMKDTANLKGTIRTLDGVEGYVSLDSGLISRSGWTLIDDTERPLYDTSDWQWVMPRSKGDRQDWYFFGYGHEYKTQLHDFTQVAGKIPLPPRFAFGLWWSRYWAYTDQEFKELVKEFENHDVPLDVLVIDMDWHQTFDLRWRGAAKDQAGQRLGWTGYTWDKTLFPDPEGFLKWCAEKKLRTPLNLHPASGIQPHEEHYPEMAKAMGIDPETQKYVPFDIVDKKFATNYLNLIIRPLERQGVDFWWLDWQQWGTTKIPGVTPTWWLNYVFFTDMERKGKDRPLLYHRWGGLGNHRYQIGFSGDAISNWNTLGFESYFTATASNVCYGYWSHDIGGHLPGPVSDELYTRWVQFGAFSPILRTHTTKNAVAERRIWAYPPEYYKAMRDAIMLRYAMIPYIYTAARKAYDTGVSICRPMYYDYPESPEAYNFKEQYMFGDDMIVAPVASEISEDSLFATKKIWFPEGEWIEWFTGSSIKGPSVLKRSFELDEVPVYVKAGAIIPMQPKMNHTEEKPVNPLILTVFPGDSGAAVLYEDAGNSNAYKDGACAWTTIRQVRSKDSAVKIAISPIKGKYPGMLKERAYEIRLMGYVPPDKIVVNKGKPLTYAKEIGKNSWSYSGDTLMTVILTDKFPVDENVDINVSWNSTEKQQSGLTDGFAGKISRLLTVADVINHQWPKEWAPDTLMYAIQTGNRINLHPQNAVEELKTFKAMLNEIPRLIKNLDIDSTARKQALIHLNDAIK